MKEKNAICVFHLYSFLSCMESKGQIVHLICKYCINLRRLFCESGRKLFMLICNQGNLTEMSILGQHEYWNNTLFNIKSHYSFYSISRITDFIFPNGLQTTVKETSYSIIVPTISSYLSRSRGQIQKE